MSRMVCSDGTVMSPFELMGELTANKQLMEVTEEKTAVPVMVG